MKLVIKYSDTVTRQTTPKELLSLLLKNRQILDFNSFLYPPPPTFNPPPPKLPNCQNILIYGDYDVDGITATAILWQAFYQHGFKITPFIPHRERDGYGFKADSFFRVQKEKGIIFDCLITVDNGIVAYSELKKLKQLSHNIKIIVIDHHLPDHNIRDLKSEIYHLVHSTDVSASALAYFVALQFDQHPDLGLAALGTVADCLPLLGINRSIVYHGLRQLHLRSSPGIRKLVELSRVKLDLISAHDLGFVLGPRINAVGRLSDPMDALRLLCSPTLAAAGKYAATLNRYNQERQSLQLDSLKQAEKNVDLKHQAIFIAGSFNPGIIGLIAGRLTEKYYLPSIVIALNGDVAKGSCRSIKELNIIEALRQCSGLLVDAGGHPGAAGFSILEKNIPKFQKKILKIINQKLKNKILEPTLEIDAQMTLAAVTPSNIKAISRLEPHGIGNPKPSFLFKGVRVVSKRLLGQNNDHLKLKLDDPATKFPENISADAVAFKKGEFDKKLKVGDLIDVVATLDLNTWGGYTTPQIIVKEIFLH